MMDIDGRVLFLYSNGVASTIRPNQSDIIVVYGKSKGKVKLSLYLTN
jgi:hypothetical protein